MGCEVSRRHTQPIAIRVIRQLQFTDMAPTYLGRKAPAHSGLLNNCQSVVSGWLESCPSLAYMHRITEGLQVPFDQR
jgi:hypothetical protein